MRKLSAYNSKRYREGRVEHPSVGGWIADIIIIAVLFAIMFVCVIPMWHTLMASLSDGKLLEAHDGIAWWWVTADGSWNLGGYIKTLTYQDYAILKSYLVTLMYVASHVVCGLIINVIGGYVLSRKTKLGKFLTLFVILTVMFNGGVIPTFIVVRSLGMVGTPLSLMIPGCTNGMFVILVMNAFRQVPESTVEAARIDGAGHFRVMFRIMLPQAWGLTLVTMINTGIMTWNSWYTAAIYVPTQTEWWPLQIWIKQMVADNADITNVINPDWNKYLVSFCVIIVSTLPILLAMPFLQKKLQKGTLAGAVKE